MHSKLRESVFRVERFAKASFSEIMWITAESAVGGERLTVTYPSVPQVSSVAICRSELKLAGRVYFYSSWTRRTNRKED